jgi:uncharacterized membrane protein YbhN (UPF0104 family)
MVPSPDDLAPQLASQRSANLLRLLGSWPLRATVSLALVLLFLWNLNWTEVAASFAAADKLLLVAAFAALALTPLLIAERWRNTAIASQILLSRGFFVRATYGSMFVGQFLPAAIGFDAARLGFLWRQKVPLRPGIQSIAADRFAGVSAILILMLAGMPFTLYLLPPPAVLSTLAIAALLVSGFTTLLLLDKFPLPTWSRREATNRLLAIVSDVRATVRTREAAFALGYGIGIHALCILAVLLLAQAFGHALQYFYLLTVISFATFAALLPISLNGWGVREGTMVIALSLFSIGPDVALMISVLYGVGLAMASLPGSLAWHHFKSAHSGSPKS